MKRALAATPLLEARHSGYAAQGGTWEDQLHTGFQHEGSPPSVACSIEIEARLRFDWCQHRGDRAHCFQSLIEAICFHIHRVDPLLRVEGIASFHVPDSWDVVEVLICIAICEVYVELTNYNLCHNPPKILCESTTYATNHQTYVVKHTLCHKPKTRCQSEPQSGHFSIRI